MIFVYDLRYACDHFVGIGTYALAVLEELLKLPGDERYVVLWDPRRAHERFDLAALRSHPRLSWTERPYDPLSPTALLRVGAWLRRARPAAYFSPYHLLPVAAGCPCVLTVHDVRPLRHAGELTGPRGWMFRRSLRRACRARRLLTVSDFSRSEILALLPADPAQVRTVRPGVRPGLARQVPRPPERRPTGPYALVVGDNRPHKNHAVLVAAWAELGNPPPLALVVAGPVDPRHADLAAQARAAGVEVMHLGRVREDELTWLYRQATLLLLPSRYEGFGSPLVEAFAHGLPAIVSDIPVLRETAGEAARFVAPDRPGDWAVAVRELAADAGARDRLRAAGRERAAELTYARTAAGVLATLREVATGGRP